MAKHVCPIDGRSFSSARALQQHRSSLHSNGAGRRRTPAAAATPKSPNNLPRPQTQRFAPVGGPSAIVTGAAKPRVESGTDLLSLVTITAPGAVGKHLMDIGLNPRNFPGTRLHTVAMLWTNWRPKRFTLRVIPSAGTYISGAYAMGWTPDVNDRIGQGVSAVRKVATYRPNVSAHVSKTATLNVPTETTQRWLYNTREEEDSQHGTIQAVQTAQIPNVTAGSTYTLAVYLDWSIEFKGPEIAPDETAALIQARGDYAKYFTDSVTNWGEGVPLSLKERQGGSLVVFPDIVHGIVYKIQTGATLEYYKDASSKGKINYGVAIPGYQGNDGGYNCMAVFEERAKAQAFATSGDISHCLKYNKAGPVVTPDNPFWQPTTVEAVFRARGAAHPVFPAGRTTTQMD